MTPLVVVFLYLAVVFYIGIFAFRKPHPSGAEDFFVAGRSLGPAVFLLSLFGSHMTAFAILGSSGHAFSNGIVTYGLMASSSAIVVPALLHRYGTRIWSLGKRHGFLTPVQMFRHRWECGHIGSFISLVQAALLVPYIVISVMGGGTVLAAVSGGRIPYWAGGALVAMVVMSYVFFGGMRGTAWVNAFQTTLFLVFGAITVVLVGWAMGGFPARVESLLSDPKTSVLLTRERVSPAYFFSYTFLPLSAIAFPHISIFCLTARRLSNFRPTIVLYPLCLLAVWLPAVFLGTIARTATDVPAIAAKLQQGGRADDILILLLGHYAPPLLAGVLSAGILAAVMASDSQILALSTLFTEDLFAYYGGKERFGERAQVNLGRAFVVVITLVAYVIALRVPAAIFDVATQYAFTGYAAMAVLVGGVFWRGSTKWGALAATLWIAAAVAGIAWYQSSGARLTVYGMLPVVPVTLIAAALMILVSLVTRKPSPATLSKYAEGFAGSA